MNGLLLPSLLPASWKLQGTEDQGPAEDFFLNCVLRREARVKGTAG